MKTHTILLSATLGLTLGLSASVTTKAEAKIYKTFKVGSWSATAHVDADSGAFTHCAASAKYRSGIRLIFSITKDQKWGIGLSKNSWKLTSGKTYPVRFQVDRKDVRSSSAKAVDEDLVYIRLPGESRLFAQMRRGRTLKVEAGDELLKFSLKSTNRMLKSLLKCSVAYKNVVAENQSANPFKDMPTGSSTSPEGTPDYKARWQAEARVRAETMLKSIGVTGRFVEPNTAPGVYSVNDSVWSMGKFMGTIRIYPDADRNNIDALVAKSEKGKCDGDFQTRVKPATIDGVSIKMRSAICKKDDGTQWSAFYTVYPRSPDSHYLLTMFTTKASLPDTLQIGEHLSKVVTRQATARPVGNSEIRSVGF